MKRAGSFLGPVGLLFVSLGYTFAIGIARLFVTLESVCTQHCPVIKVQGFRFHHMYYGVLLLLVSLGVMIYASDARARWDSALVAGIGLGLIADEIGLLILKLSYWNIISVSIFAGGGLLLYLATALKSWRAGLSDFHFVDKYQFLALMGLLLGLTGFLFFDRPARMVVEATALGAWLASAILVTKYGRRHFFLLRNAPLNYPSPNR
ncbi:hypothetical protein AUF78_14550 [archaeon 13_1_20CM_2_51_12]|nr:MAG: hypothetical protein AUF78_14550 [archaeon 13_1_20CM_2_51_12]